MPITLTAEFHRGAAVYRGDREPVSRAVVIRSRPPATSLHRLSGTRARRSDTTGALLLYATLPPLHRFADRPL